MTVQEFLFKHGQNVQNVDVDASLNEFLRQKDLGLRGEGGSLPLIPAYLTDVSRDRIERNSKRIVIDAGGTNFRSALGYFDEDGKAHIEDIVKTVMPASDGYLGKSQFYAAIADNVSRLLPLSDKIGFCFSYPVQMGADGDGTVQPFTKEINAPEVVGTKVGGETVAACKALDGKDRRIVILNDTVATLLGGMAGAEQKFSAYLGYIYGTGTNVCYIEDTDKIVKARDLAQGRMIVNSECGNFDGFECGDFDRAAIERTSAPQFHRFEKMTAGKYLADVIFEALTVAAKENMFGTKPQLSRFDLKDVSDFLNGGGLNGAFADREDAETAREICFGVIERAAKMGAIVNSALAISSCKDKTLPVAIAAEGTTFNKLPRYRDYFERYLTDILGRFGIGYKILQGEDLNLIGTLMATMVQD